MELRKQMDLTHDGVWVDLGDGASVCLCALGNVEFLNRYDIEAELWRKQRGRSVEDPVSNVGNIEVTRAALPETVVKGWKGYTLDGVELSDKHEDGAFHRENCRLLLGLPVIARRWLEEARKLEASAKSDEEIAEKNLPEPSPIS